MSFRIIVNIEYGVVVLFLCFRYYRLFIIIYKKNYFLKYVYKKFCV